jgi:TonB family protein
MNDRGDIEELFLPEDLRALDRELRSIRYEERPSFGPELRAELARAWAAPRRRRGPVLRYLAAAMLAGVFVGGAAVPSARASLVRLLDVFAAEVPVVEEAPLPAPVALTTLPRPEVLEPAPVVDVAAAPPSIVVAADPVPSQPPIPPQMLDRERAVMLLERAYPPHLQRQGIGGVVWLRVLVDRSGLAGPANVSRGSGVRELDRAALEVVPLLRFSPAMQGGEHVATWIEFPVQFEPDPAEIEPIAPPADDPLRLPLVHPDDRWEYEQPLELDEVPQPVEETSNALSAAEAALVQAIGDPMVRRSLGPVEAILSGIAPEGDPTEWRAAAGRILEDAVERDPANPAPLLALGRIRLRQGLRTEARMLFEQGLQIAIQHRATVPAEIVAELHVERGRLIQAGWLAAHEVGRVHAWAFDAERCAQARSSGGAASGYASIERLIAWNYLCPLELEHVFDEGFETIDESTTDQSLTMASFRAAIDAVPGHVGANVGLLMGLADAGRWSDVLAGARRFARRSGGHPYAFLIAGLALQRLGEPVEAMAHFEVALGRLPTTEAERLRDITFIIDRARVGEYRRLWGDERRATEVEYWASKDRTPTNAVNEREVQHLARSTYAHLRLGGVTSDPGEVWIRFGGPKRVHTVDAGSGQLTEFWDYGSGPDITFVRWVASQTMDLTPEGRAYVDDLGKIFPPQ